MKGNDDIIIEAKVEIKGRYHRRPRGLLGQVNWGGNVVYNFTYAMSSCDQEHVRTDIPNNDGCARPIRLTAPEGTVINCKFPARGARMGGPLPDGGHLPALSDVLPGKVIAASGGTPRR
jgi:N-methylhydantoinase B